MPPAASASVTAPVSAPRFIPIESWARLVLKRLGVPQATQAQPGAQTCFLARGAEAALRRLRRAGVPDGIAEKASAPDAQKASAQAANTERCMVDDPRDPGFDCGWKSRGLIPGYGYTSFVS